MNLLLLVLGSIAVAARRGQDPAGAHPASTLAPRDATGEPYAFLELSTARDSYYVQEPIRVRLQFGFDVQFVRDHMIQLFRRPLDIPAQLEAPWLRELPGAIVLEDDPAEPAREQSSFALGDTMAAAARIERVEVGRTFAGIEIEKCYLPAAAGPLEIPGALVRFAYATRFDDDFVNGRVPADRTDAFVRGKPTTLRIRPLPEEGRPASFSGAVGHFSVEAESLARELAPGESFQLELRIEGEGNLGTFAAPHLDELADFRAGFRINGQIERKSRTRRVVTYDLTPVDAPPDAAVTRIPSIAFTFFDPDPPGGYRTVRTRAIPLVVGPARGAASTATTARRGAIPESEPKESFPWLLVIVVLLLALGVWLFVRRR